MHNRQREKERNLIRKYISRPATGSIAVRFARQTLLEMRAWASKPHEWCRDWEALDETREPVDPIDPSARQWSAQGWFAREFVPEQSLPVILLSEAACEWMQKTYPMTYENWIQVIPKHYDFRQFMLCMLNTVGGRIALIECIDRALVMLQENIDQFRPSRDKRTRVALRKSKRKAG